MPAGIKASARNRVTGEMPADATEKTARAKQIYMDAVAIGASMVSPASMRSRTLLLKATPTGR